MENEKRDRTRTVSVLWRRILPCLVFAAALAALLAVFYRSGHTALPEAEQRYERARQKAAALRLDDARAASRESWENLAMEFRAVYDAALGWPDRQVALFGVAESLEELARLSLVKNDARRAVDVYEDVVARHPQGGLADDALFRAARLRAAWLMDEQGALSLVAVIKNRQQNGSRLQEALALEKILTASISGRMASEEERAAVDTTEARDEGVPEKDAPENRPVGASLTGISWDSKGLESVEITLVLSGPASCTSRMLKSRDGWRMRLNLDKVRAASELGNGVFVRDSLLRGILASRNDEGTVLDIDFRREVNIVTSQSPGIIIVRAETMKKTTPPEEWQEPRVTPAAAVEDKSSRPSHPRLSKADLESRRLRGMANQLGLTVGRVFIDAGHGGHDPGAIGHDVLERRVTLDMARALGRLLEANGLEVVYSRSADTSISLSERTRKANEVRADLFVSVHVNANEDSSVNGLETYYLDFAANAGAARVAALENAVGDRRLGDMQILMAEVMVNARVEESRRLAGAVQENALAGLRRRDFTAKNNGVKAAPFHVLIGAQMPAVLVEIGYCTNRAEAANLASASYRHALAEGLAKGILAYKNSLGGKGGMRAGLEK